MNRKFAAIILAAGKGKRMNATSVNKVVYPIAGKPMILHSVELLEKVNINPIIIVVGFAKESVQEVLINKNVLFTEQEEQLGTAHALECGLKELPSDITDVLVIQGDDSAFYTKDIIQKLINRQVESNAAVTLLTLFVKNPEGLGRIVRDESGKITGIVEEKDATSVQREIHEINPACYVFSVDFLRQFLPTIEKSSVTGEYYLTSLLDIALQNNKKIETIQEDEAVWRGINTPDELEEAEKLFLSKN